MLGAIHKKSERINLRRNKSWVYMAIISFLFLGFFAFLTSKFYMPNDEKLFHTETDKAIKLPGMGKLVVGKREYNPYKNFMEIQFRLENYEETGYTFQAQEKSNPGTQLPVKVLYEENGHYVVEVQKLSPNWGAVALDIYNKNGEKEQVDIRKFTKDPSEYEEESTNKDTPNKLAYTIFTDQRKTKANDELLAKDNQEYEKDFIERDKKDWKEKMETQSKISALESKIKESEKNVELFKGEQKNAQDKIKKLEQKAQEIHKN
ncbi:hypothetical protein [Bacillus pseudomycoides]|uniref:Uncharacterized protein n=1 Tax=Bacillus pseudomycoides TaxID=64104 RepID=A0A2B5UKT3_9BACI|nr:hypothetical protein [Bacillus pseudomycoides]PDY44019.1 hypothetical protein CON79_27925 [Bacillus pseudomycoides]PEA80594.1 hypothetical protein CON99_27370 [Bacillus pseudomycoides]PED05117.1 hypothetical protein COO19_28345 [Bacillus pseudomycoides]PED68898.1 hypothetical protein CON97_28465 [Bacillus pseudomycoides]PEI35826.1 hypothetical protein CN620_24815 [Bacillus pseudomycoides]